MTSTGAGEYREALRPPLWWYPMALAVALILAAEFQVSGPIIEWLPFVILVPLALAVVWSLGRTRLTIGAGVVSIRGAHLPLCYVSQVVALDARTLRRVIGREGDPRAFVSIRPWIGPGVQLQLDDPEDPTPYWVVSTRHPERVAALLRTEM